MNQYRPSDIFWNTEKPKDLYFTSWFLIDQKWASLFMIFTATIVIVAVWLSTEVLFAILFASLVLFLTIWRVFVPTYYELNTEGVIRRTIVRKYLIAWEDIRAYEIRTDGIILLPRNDRYFLDFFRAYFLPVPTSLVPEVLYRFRIFVDKIHD